MRLKHIFTLFSNNIVFTAHKIMQSLVSICIPAYKNTRFLKRLLESLLQQTYTHFEVILSDDSPDDTVKDFDFNGWCVGGSRRLVDFMYTIALFLKNREFEKANVEFIHMLGISKVSDFFILGTYQALLNKHYGGRIQLMTDSSSPGQFPVFGDLIIGPNFSAQKWDQIHVSRDVKYREEDLMPTLFHTPITKNWNMKIINDYKQEYYDRGTLQNLLIASMSSIFRKCGEIPP
jgi:glycosyltransferase involved in cell wall biosynthesis